MVTKNHKVSMTPQLIAAVPGVAAQIKVSRAYLLSLPLTNAEHLELEKACQGQSICPAQFWYPDNARMRALLRVGGEPHA